MHSSSPSGGGLRARRPPRWLRWTTSGFALFLFALVAIANSGTASRTLLDIAHAIPGGDKTVHFVLMGTMAGLLNMSLAAAAWRLGPLLLQKGSLLVAAVVTAEEIVQLWIPARAFSWDDLLFDFLGIVLIGQLGAALWHFASAPARAVGMGAADVDSR